MLDEDLDVMVLLMGHSSKEVKAFIARIDKLEADHLGRVGKAYSPRQGENAIRDLFNHEHLPVVKRLQRAKKRIAGLIDVMESRGLVNHPDFNSLIDTQDLLYIYLDEKRYLDIFDIPKLQEFKSSLIAWYNGIVDDNREWIHGFLECQKSLKERKQKAILQSSAIMNLINNAMSQYHDYLDRRYGDAGRIKEEKFKANFGHLATLQKGVIVHGDDFFKLGVKALQAAINRVFDNSKRPFYTSDSPAGNFLSLQSQKQGGICGLALYKKGKLFCMAAPDYDEMVSNIYREFLKLTNNLLDIKFKRAYWEAFIEYRQRCFRLEFDVLRREDNLVDKFTERRLPFLKRLDVTLARDKQEITNSSFQFSRWSRLHYRRVIYYGMLVDIITNIDFWQKKVSGLGEKVKYKERNARVPAGIALMLNMIKQQEESLVSMEEKLKGRDKSIKMLQAKSRAFNDVCFEFEKYLSSHSSEESKHRKKETVEFYGLLKRLIHSNAQPETEVVIALKRFAERVSAYGKLLPSENSYFNLTPTR